MFSEWSKYWTSTKTEQADLFQALYGRHEAPVVVCAKSIVSLCLLAKDCTSTDACYSLTDGYLAFG
jgi:hypothetical protein